MEDDAIDDGVKEIADAVLKPFITQGRRASPDGSTIVPMENDYVSKSEFADFKGDVKAEFAAIRGDMKTGFAELRADMHQMNAGISRWMLGSMLTIITTIVVGIGGLALATFNAIKTPQAQPAPIVINVPQAAQPQAAPGGK